MKWKRFARCNDAIYIFWNHVSLYILVVKVVHQRLREWYFGTREYTESSYWWTGLKIRNKPYIPPEHYLLKQFPFCSPWQPSEPQHVKNSRQNNQIMTNQMLQIYRDHQSVTVEYIVLYNERKHLVQAWIYYFILVL
jgi:hypothetical protein